MSEQGTNPVIAGELPKREQLEKTISFYDYLAIGLGAILGVGWVVYAGHWVQSGGVLGAMLAFAIGGLCLVPIGKCYAELTAAIPVTGGEIAFSYMAFGPTAAFCVGWLLTLGYLAIVPFETIAIGSMAESIFPSLKAGTIYSLGGYNVSASNVLPGLAAAVGVSLLNLRGNSESTRLQMLALLAMVGCTALFCSFAIWEGSSDNLFPLFATNGSSWTIAPASIASVLVVVPFFLMGFDCIPQVAEEAGVELQPRKIGLAIVATIILGSIFYIVIILALSFGVSRGALENIIAQPDVMPMAEVFRQNLGSERLAKLVLIAALLGLLTTLNGIFIAGTRILFALGRGGLLPHWFCEISSNRTPSNAILVVGTLACIGPFVGKAGLTPIVSAFSFVICLVMLSTALSALRLKSIRPDLERPYRTKTSTIWLAVLVILALLCLMLVPSSPGRLGSSELYVLGAWLLIGIAVHGYQRRRPVSRTVQDQMFLAQYAEKQSPT